MVRGGIALALCASLGGCHVLFGHSPGAGSGGDGRPLIEGGARDTRQDRPHADGRPDQRPSVELPLKHDAGPGCGPASWCPEPTQQPLKNTLHSVSSTDDARAVYIAGESIVLRSTTAQRIWQPIAGLPVATWRGVHVLPTEDALVVGNDGSGTAVAYRIPKAGSPLPLAVGGGLKDHALNALWTDAAGQGHVATSAKTSYGGTLSLVSLSGSSVTAGPSFGAPILAVDGAGLEIWAGGEKGWFGTHDLSWVSTTLSGSPTLRGVVALGLELACVAGASGSAGYLACCTYFLPSTLDCPYQKTFSAVSGVGPLRDVTTAGLTLIVVGDGGVIASAGVSLVPLIVNGFGKEAAPTQGALRSVWGAIVPSSSTGTYDAWAVGDGGVILHRRY
jgi:hypothetical protein